jgi:hypothetical protein
LVPTHVCVMETKIGMSLVWRTCIDGIAQYLAESARARERERARDHVNAIMTPA